MRPDQAEIIQLGNLIDTGLIRPVIETVLPLSDARQAFERAWHTMLLPPPIIDYIVVHEVVHLHERCHNRPFWERVERAMPDYAIRKHWLTENGSRF